MTAAPLSDRYEVVRPLGAGTGGVVFFGTDRETGEAVAIKQFRRAVGSRPALKEASVILGVHHPNIVRCQDFFYLGAGDLYLIYEFVNGGTLREVLDQGAMPRDEALLAARDLLRGLIHLHSSGLVHCDLKPENILVERLEGRGPLYKVGDLGVAHSAAELERERNIAGTPAYMAPERFVQAFSFNADLYSLGVMLYEMLTGRRPFEGSPQELARAHLRQAPDLAAVTEPRLRDYLGGLLDKDPRYRVPTAEVALRHLEAVLNRTSTPTRLFGGEKLRRKDPAKTVHLGSFAVPGAIDRVVSLHHRGVPYVAVETGTHAEVLEGAGGAPINLFIPNLGHGLQAVRPDTLVYGTRSRICRFDLATHTENTLLDGCPRISALYLTPDLQKLLWSNGKTAWLHDFRAQRAVSFPCSNFGLDPLLRLRRDGLILFSTGPIRPALNFAGPDGLVRRQIPLAGPALEMTDGPEDFLLLTLNAGDQGHYMLYHIRPDFSVETRVLRGRLQAFDSSGDRLWTVGEDGLVQSWAPGFEVTEITRVTPGLNAVSVTPDGRFLHALFEIAGRREIRCYAPGA